MTEQCDVLIMGAGLAGGCLARQLRLSQPELKIVVVDKQTEFGHWVGESTVEVFYDYVTRTLRLGPYIWKNHYLKHGLRFFWDTEDTSLRIPEMSENGRCPYAIIPAYQIDRATFDRDLCEINRNSGVDVRLGVKVESVELDREGHVVETSAGTIRCRWVVDAGGFGGPIVKKLKLSEVDERHPVGSAWARYKRTVPIDELGDDEWRRRVGYSQRHLSTNHFMHRGYWIWLIPLDEDTVSLGVVYHREMKPLQIRDKEELTAFLRSHKGLDELLGPDGEAQDFHSFKQVTRRSKQRFSTDRWFLAGMAGSFVDPMQSQQCVTLATTNRFITEMIRADSAGEEALFKSQVMHFNLMAQTAYEDFVRALDYRLFGSFDAFVGWRHARQAKYWNSTVPNSITDLRYNLRVAADHVGGCSCSLEGSYKDNIERSMSSAVNRLATEFVDFLERHNRYYARNGGEWQESTERWTIQKKLWLKERDVEAELAEDLHSYESAFRYYVSRMASIEEVPFSEKAFSEWFVRDWESGQSLTEALELLRRAPAPEGDVMPPATGWSPQGPPEEFRWTHHLETPERKSEPVVGSGMKQRTLTEA